MLTELPGKLFAMKPAIVERSQHFTVGKKPSLHSLNHQKTR
jgi:hypothetical protein